MTAEPKSYRSMERLFDMLTFIRALLLPLLLISIAIGLGWWSLSVRSGEMLEVLDITATVFFFAGVGVLSVRWEKIVRLWREATAARALPKP